MGRLVLVTGGARSGKSRYAERLVEAEGVPVVYVATMEGLDEETGRRVAHRREARPGNWRTVEEPVDLAEVLRREHAGAAVLVECLATWCGKLFWRAGLGEDDPPERREGLVERVVEAARQVAECAKGRAGLSVVVTNEVGWGIVPMGRSSRYYRDALGLVNQVFGAAAEAVVLVAAGRALVLGDGVAGD